MNRPHRRAHPRKRVELPVTIEMDSTTTEGRCTNMSLGGTFIALEGRPAFGSQMKLLLRFPGFPKERVLHATVRWEGQGGVGVQFSPLDAATTYELTEFLATCPAEPEEN